MLAVADMEFALNRPSEKRGISCIHCLAFLFYVILNNILCNFLVVAYFGAISVL
jgi:hypothetical protein